MSNKTMDKVAEMAAKRERDRILAIIQAGEWSGESLAEDIANLEALIKGENE